MIKRTALCSLIALSLSQPVFSGNSENQELPKLLQFLVSDKILVPSKDKLAVPLSYYIGDKESIATYFGDYVCARAEPESTCSVIDALYKTPYAILGDGLPPKDGTKQQVAEAQAQIERTDMFYGADIYDAATWQIALALGAKYGHIDKEKAETLINNQFKRINHKDNKATDSVFQYGYRKSINKPAQAFTFRMLATDFHNKDPFYQSRYQEYVTPLPDTTLLLLSKNDKDHHSPEYFKYATTWSDWKPITGENAWALLIGPLQAEYLLHQGKISANSLNLINAMNSLYAFSAMQSATGGIYYAPGGSDGNQGPIPAGEISLENNFSVLGGLQILDRVLHQTEQTDAVQKAEHDVKTLLYGGTTVNGFATKGLLSFIYNHAFDKEKGIFYTHGQAINPSVDDWRPDTSTKGESMAIDVNTWGIAALGVETIDAWYGKGIALKMWNKVKEQGGYYNNGKLWGVGYTLDNQHDQIMSTEWTAGAINAVHALIKYYDGQGLDTTGLQQDLTSMQEGVSHLRTDQYLGSGFDHETPKAFFMTVQPEDGYAYLYASKRFAIPFGWNANTLPSTTSNAWIVMNKIRADGFNPFQYQGKLLGENYPKPEATDNPDEKKGLPQAVSIAFDAGIEGEQGNLGSITQLSLSYKTNLEGNWINAATINTDATNRSGMAKLPEGTKAISIAFNNNGWAGACQVMPATKICKDKTCLSIRSIHVTWSADGSGPCGLVD